MLLKNYTYPACLLAAMCLAKPLKAEEFKITSGFDYSTGDYGEEVDTDILFVPVTFNYLEGPWSLKLMVPWIQIEGPGNVVGGGDAGVIVDRASTEKTTESGLGDIWASVGYAVESIPPELFYMDVVVKTKFPTADEDKGLGTGEFDYTLQLDFFKPFEGNLTPMATIAYKIKGDPDEYSLYNVFYLSVGADYRWDEDTNLGATLDYQEASTDSADDRLEVFSYLSHRIDEDWKLTGYTYFGLTDGSPDVGGGISVGYTF